MPRRRRIKQDGSADLIKLCKPGDRVTLWTRMPKLPWTNSMLIDAIERREEQLGVTQDIDDAQDCIVGLINGSVCGMVREVSADQLEIVHDNDPGYPDGHSTYWVVAELTHIRVDEPAAPASEARFGTATMRFHLGTLHVNGAVVNPALVSAVAKAFGWTYVKDPTSDNAQRVAWERSSHGTPRLGPDGFTIGCVNIPIEELDEALDWCAERLWP